MTNVSILFQLQFTKAVYSSALSEPMHAEIIAIGSELTTGAKLDTNSRWLSVELAAVGIPVQYHSTVSDDNDAMLSVIRTAVARSDIVLITGGLGPTLDDLTRQCLAELTGSELILHEPSLEFIKSSFTKRELVMPESNIIQAMFPARSEPIPNSWGTAPGIWMEIPRPDGQSLCQVAALPGVPTEMKPMFYESVLPRLPLGEAVIRQACVNSFGTGESAVEQLLGDVTARGRDPEVGITAHEATITLRITAQGKSPQECEDKIAATKAVIHDRMGDLIFGEDDEELEHVVLRLLNERRLTLATIETGTGGLLAHRLADVGRHEECFRGALVVPNGTVKSGGVTEDAFVLTTAGPVNARRAGEMAAGCRGRFQTDFALAIAKCPDSDSTNDETGTKVTYLALAGENLLETHEHKPVNNPAIAKSRAVKAALNLLRLHLIRSLPIRLRV